jgi:hypothetical protein
MAHVEAQPVELACRPETVVAGPKAAPKLLEDWGEQDAVRLLAGRSGSGKSTAVLDMQRRAAERGIVVVVANAEDYIAGRLPALIAAGLNRHTYLGAHPAVGTAALADPDATVASMGLPRSPMKPGSSWRASSNSS